MASKDLDPATLTESEIIEAIKYHCQRMGSHAYYIADEIEAWRKVPAGLHVYRDRDNGKLRAYHDRGTPHGNRKV